MRVLEGGRAGEGNGGARCWRVVGKEEAEDRFREG